MSDTFQIRCFFWTQCNNVTLLLMLCMCPVFCDTTLLIYNSVDHRD